MLTTRTLTITIKGPILTRSTAISDFGVDAPVARLDDGTPYLPGSHILDKARHTLRHLMDIQKSAGVSGPIDADYLLWFGNKGDEKLGQNERRRIFVSDLVARAPSKAASIRTRIRIDPKRGAAEHGALLTLETPYETGEDVEFSGHLDIIAKNETETAKILKALRLALNWTSQVGGLRTISFGRIVKAEISGAAKAAAPSTPAPIELATAATSASAATLQTPAPVATEAEIDEVLSAPAPLATKAAECLALILHFRDPLCVAETRNSGNSFITSDVVPGSVIKGALANLIVMGAGLQAGTPLSQSSDFPKLAQWFSRLRISHCFPATLEYQRRPRQWNKSLVVDQNDGFHDAAHWDGPRLINSRAPAFYHYWKDQHFTKAANSVSWPHVTKSLRVRTAIDYAAGRAKDEALFAYELLEVTKHQWIGEIGLEDIPDEERFQVTEELIQALAAGLPGVGRSQSFATLAKGAFQPVTKAKLSLGEDALIVLTLQTPALLRAPNKIYKDAVTELSGGTLKLLRHFASERLSGASFMANRYFRGKQYKPWLLTEAGSVFVVKSTGINDPTTILQDITTNGLSIGQGIKTFYGLGSENEAQLWKACPYIRQNGFGEVVATIFSKR